MRPFHARLSWALCLVLIAGAWAQESDPYGQAMDQATKDVKAIADDVKKQRAYLGQARAALEAAEEELKGSSIDPAQKKAALEKVRDVSKALKELERPLKRFTDAVAPVTKAQEVWKELNDMKAQVASDQATMGDLAAEMRVISKVMTSVGKKVPLIGGFIETYGKMTNGVLDATGKVAETLAQERNQGMVGLGAYDSGTARTMNEALKTGFPELHDGMTFEPSQPPWVYIPVGQEKKPQLIWDGAAGTWEKVPDTADAVEIFRRSLRAGRRPDPASLLILCNHWDKAQLRQQAAAEILAFIDSLRRSMDDDVLGAFRAVYFHSNPVFDDLEDAIEDPDGFASQYMYARDCYVQTNALLGNMYQALSDHNADANVLARLAALGKKYGIQEIPIEETRPSLLTFVPKFMGLHVRLRGTVTKSKTDEIDNPGSDYADKRVQDEYQTDIELIREIIPVSFTGRNFSAVYRYKRAKGTLTIRGTMSADFHTLETLSFEDDCSRPVDESLGTGAAQRKVTVDWAKAKGSGKVEPNGVLSYEQDFKAADVQASWGATLDIVNGSLGKHITLGDLSVTEGGVSLRFAPEERRGDPADGPPFYQDPKKDP